MTNTWKTFFFFWLPWRLFSLLCIGLYWQLEFISLVGKLGFIGSRKKLGRRKEVDWCKQMHGIIGLMLCHLWLLLLGLVRILKLLYHSIFLCGAYKVWIHVIFVRTTSFCFILFMSFSLVGLKFLLYVCFVYFISLLNTTPLTYKHLFNFLVM